MCVAGQETRYERQGALCIRRTARVMSVQDLTHIYFIAGAGIVFAILLWLNNDKD